MKTLSEFGDLVRKMRAEQDRYFKGLKTDSQLKICKALEKQVDEELEKQAKKVGKQSSIF